MYCRHVVLVSVVLNLHCLGSPMRCDAQTCILMPAASHSWLQIHISTAPAACSSLHIAHLSIHCTYLYLLCSACERPFEWCDCLFVLQWQVKWPSATTDSQALFQLHGQAHRLSESMCMRMHKVFTLSTAGLQAHWNEVERLWHAGSHLFQSKHRFCCCTCV